MNNFETKKLVFSQRKNWKLFLNKNNFQFDVENLIFYPETTLILQNIECQEKLKVDCKRKVEMIFFEKYLDYFNGNEQLYVIFPDVSLGSNFYNTSLPILKDTKDNIKKVLQNINLLDIDYFAISNLDFKKFVKIEGCADYPNEKNEFYDGVIYDYFVNFN
ncbi:hypothetical protein F935_01771 [Acinetobacter calcoaceticus ANC 3811]|uniref:Uncharacterized protein n=1 Tax=Acinetobacter calcoaceticus ANC 3811 TaxID=1217690 RepID=R8Y5C4_ACICA|nr:hypothetical protein [Acinetobacter calcoaceticus]EOQ62682.1 hypothetical protein F935_01771 [Acinetobacter calcoaceticus ANC 3811]